MKPLDHRRSIDAYKFNHTANVIKKNRTTGQYPGTTDEFCRTDETYLQELYPADTIFSLKMKKI